MLQGRRAKAMTFRSVSASDPPGYDSIIRGFANAIEKMSFADLGREAPFRF